VQESLNGFIQRNPAAVLVFVVAFWCFIIFLVSMVTGWFALTRRFRKQSEPCGEIRSAGPFFYTVYMRYWCHYSSGIRLTAASDALFLSVILPLRIGHPPLRIPWNEIQFGRTRRFLRDYIDLTLGSEERIPLRIPERMAAKLGLLDRVPGQAAKPDNPALTS
jgi:hypothetical protein